MKKVSAESLLFNNYSQLETNKYQQTMQKLSFNYWTWL